MTELPAPVWRGRTGACLLLDLWSSIVRIIRRSGRTIGDYIVSKASPSVARKSSTNLTALR